MGRAATNADFDRGALSKDDPALIGASSVRTRCLTQPPLINPAANDRARQQRQPMLVRSILCLSLALLSCPIAATNAFDAASLRLQTGALKLEDRDTRTIYRASALLPLGFGYVRAETAHASGAALSFDRSQLLLGIHHELFDRAHAFAAVGIERLRSRATIELTDSTTRRLSQDDYSAGLELGLSWHLHNRWTMQLSLAHFDRKQSSLRASLPASFARLSNEWRIGKRVSLVADIVTGEDYREYLLGPEWNF
ncbi:hypothetical protein [Pseudomarimonas arenosa]|uniref:DUF481 domain-containing protein n=1 Tax=Pseudomarimonas arenosa TaxID=2774145 RepID=A0AAW3ZLZ9_9GAMM|nr:hypothetical protein [Pseudomarimonas arenosa]MBD8525674.1 hypothetical protein [Pseudomarimonas arenosa]